jgi:hypothetical protein
LDSITMLMPVSFAKITIPSPPPPPLHILFMPNEKDRRRKTCVKDDQTGVGK